MKFDTFRKFVMVCLLATILGACNTAAPTTSPDSNLTQVPPVSVPTLDTNLIRTEAAQTVIAQITQEAAANPSPTAAPPTETPTLEPSQTPAESATSTVVLPSATATKASTPTRKPGGGAGVFIPTKTYYTDSCSVSVATPDGIIVSPGWDFDAQFTVVNTGMRPWNTSFYFKPIKSTLYTSNSIVYLPYNIGNGEEASLTLDMQAPKEPGIYYSTWGLVNDDGTTFCTFAASVKVE